MIDALHFRLTLPVEQYANIEAFRKTFALRPSAQRTAYSSMWRPRRAISTSRRERSLGQQERTGNPGLRSQLWSADVRLESAAGWLKVEIAFEQICRALRGYEEVASR